MLFLSYQLFESVTSEETIETDSLIVIVYIYGSNLQLQFIRCELFIPRNHEKMGCSEVNKFEQVSSDDYQMSLARWTGVGVSGPMSREPCSVKSNASWVMVT